MTTVLVIVSVPAVIVCGPAPAMLNSILSLVPYAPTATTSDWLLPALMDSIASRSVTPLSSATVSAVLVTVMVAA